MHILQNRHDNIAENKYKRAESNNSRKIRVTHINENIHIIYDRVFVTQIFVNH